MGLLTDAVVVQPPVQLEPAGIEASEEKMAYNANMIVTGKSGSIFVVGKYF